MPRNLIIFGSPNSSSFTARLLKGEIGGLKGEAITYNCFELAPAPCDGCGLCKEQAACKHSDLDAFFKDFELAENVIFAFPIYNGSFPAPLKALIDRFQLFYNARFARNVRPPIKGRRNVTLIITAGSNIDPLPLILKQLAPMFTISGCTLKKAVVLCGTDNLTLDDTLTPQITNY